VTRDEYNRLHPVRLGPGPRRWPQLRGTPRARVTIELSGEATHPDGTKTPARVTMTIDERGITYGTPRFGT
jgi:hypothetical protein